MQRILLISVVVSTGIGLLLLGCVGTQQVIMPHKTYKLDSSMTRDEFKQLPEGAVVEINGRQMTKQQYLKERAEAEKARVSVQAAEMKKAAETAEVCNTVAEKWRADLLKIRAESTNKLAALVLKEDEIKKSKRFKDLQREVMDLEEKSKKASSAETASIQKRKLAIERELRKMGLGRSDDILNAGLQARLELEKEHKVLQGREGPVTVNASAASK